MSASGKPIALVTGGNAGIGFETCKGLVQAGYHVVVGARSEEKAEAAIRKLREVDESATLEPLVMDLASLVSIRQAAAAFLATGRPLSVLVLNAGVMALPHKVTRDGFEQQWQVNVLGHFLLCRLLLPSVMTADSGRIVHVASGAHRLHPFPIDYELLEAEHETECADFNEWRAYGRSKLANILVSNELARRLAAADGKSSSAITSNALHPGSVRTDLWDKAGSPNDPRIPAVDTRIPVEEGALTSIYLSLSDEAEGRTGGYYFQCKPVTTIFDKELQKNWTYVQQAATRTAVSTSEEEGAKLWRVLSQQVGLSENL